VATATAVDGCPVCGLPHPCPTQVGCLVAWGNILLALLDVEGDDE
jgi:hypothetical protein